jgi:hypothetical protein
MTPLATSRSVFADLKSRIVPTMKPNTVVTEFALSQYNVLQVRLRYSRYCYTVTE